MLKRSLKWKEAEHVFLLEWIPTKSTVMIMLLRLATTATVS